jgi:3-deoxy-manno-octulosonate cytidylyltransferase (CMP-KDO synthetase)
MDRVAAVARGLPEEAAIAHVQGDEPVVHPESLRQLAQALAAPAVGMVTLVRRLLPAERRNPNVVKVALALNGEALYFSRSDIPHQSGAVVPPRYAHLGLYAYRREVLLRLASLPPSPLELAEQLEQLRALENGIRIHCVMTTHHSLAVDVPEDVARAEAALSTQSD